MSPQMERAHRLRDMMNTAGWRMDIEPMFAEHMKTPLDEFYEILIHKTVQATGSEAYFKAGKSEGCRNLLEEIHDAVKLLDNAK